MDNNNIALFVKKAVVLENTKRWLKDNIEFLRRLAKVKFDDDYLRVDGELSAMQACLNKIEELEDDK
jgi:hypothetical protein